MAPKRCFVVMGFGIKTDLATGRKLNLDKSYQALIKPVVEGKGMVCIRADEIKHSGPIDLQMFQQLFSADLVIADLSTSNLNAFYELGIRHALKPHTTIIISEAQMAYPFNIQNLTIKNYTHLGDSIDYFEVLRFQQLLGETIEEVLQQSRVDSPVYNLLDGLVPPSLRDQAQAMADKIGAALEARRDAAAPVENGEDNTSLAFLVRQGEEALRKKEFEAAKIFFDSALRLSDSEIDNTENSHNTYLIQRLALATYKSEQPDYVTALKQALALLDKIDLGRTNDPETVALAGSIEKHLFEEGQGNEHLDNAILYYQRGFYLLHNRHNGINLAYLLHQRALTSLDPTREEKIADIVWANRFRRDVLQLCEKDAAKNLERETMASGADSFSEEEGNILNEQKFWILVNKAEAHFGLGEMDEYEAAAAAAAQVKHDEWMMECFTRQLKNLSRMLEQEKAMA